MSEEVTPLFEVLSRLQKVLSYCEGNPEHLLLFVFTASSLTPVQAVPTYQLGTHSKYTEATPCPPSDVLFLHPGHPFARSPLPIPLLSLSNHCPRLTPKPSLPPDHVVFDLSFVNVVCDIDLCMLHQPCELGINPSWSWCMIFCYVLLDL